ncbi:MAG TPA: DUF2459 domain-containing protein [Ignavibacteriaceae bacterium]|nr:DUF2459 domain-containing protein [Ignavibacteriaceae bacterium]
MIRIAFIIFIINFRLFALAEDSLKTIYLVKQGWHTGILINLKDLDDNNIIKKEFQEFNFVDIGWGDSAFYQTPGFDFNLAFQALFFSSASTLRIQGYKNINNIDKAFEDSRKLMLNQRNFDNIKNFIDSSFYKKDNKIILYSTEAGNTIKFYKSNGNYSAYYTCNTWIADALRRGNFDIDSNVIVVEQLFKAIDKFK